MAGDSPRAKSTSDKNTITNTERTDKKPTTTEIVDSIKLLNTLLFFFKQWPSHDKCFHTTFVEWLDCQFTCVEEVQEFFRKI